MKPEIDSKVEENDNPLPVGDVIGDTAYSERFVLKILIKLANLDTLKNEIKEKSFEEDLCMLWDMTAERDVVLFLQKHDSLNLINFALPMMDSPRLIEIMIGIVGNMCCQKEVVSSILKMDGFLMQLLEHSKCDDSLTLVQLLRLINSCLFLSNDSDIPILMTVFESVGYSPTLYFILKNSSHKDLLVTALENMNAICSSCNTERHSSKFLMQFLRSEALDSLSAAITEITTNLKDSFRTDEIERSLIISLQISLHLLGFDSSAEIYENSKDDVIVMMRQILDYYEEKLVIQKEIEPDLIDIIESISTIINILNLNNICDLTKYFDHSYKMWKAVNMIMKSDKDGATNFEQDDKVELLDFTSKIKAPLCTLMCNYMATCSDENLLKCLDVIGQDYDDIITSLDKEKLHDEVNKRTEKYRTRLKENIDS
ncbi:protein saal1 [Bombyx mandarina]|uniref:Protein saal1 n=1 Tax=Bombyx mandarina TaxID=7092 RepID=A0A6J2KIC3_BOMMA|nr:protein saal1 [Bombyx mandarina]